MTDEPHVTVFADDRRLVALAAYTDRIDELAEVFADAMAGDGELLDRRPAPDAWSVGEVLHHLADTELLASYRLRRMLTEDRPAWEPFDPEAYAAALGYDARPPADALTLVLSLRHVNVRLLASLAPDQWARTALHPEVGELDVAAWVERESEHLAQHVLQARRAVIGMI
jgi:hypothetical protein